MKELLESEEFFNGVIIGINLYQQKVIMVSVKSEPLKIGNELYYVENGRKWLQEMLDKICK